MGGMVSSCCLQELQVQHFPSRRPHMDDSWEVWQRFDGVEDLFFLDLMGRGRPGHFLRKTVWCYERNTGEREATFTLLLTSQAVLSVWPPSSSSLLSISPVTSPSRALLTTEPAGPSLSSVRVRNVKVKIFLTADCLDKNSPGRPRLFSCSLQLQMMWCLHWDAGSGCKV